MGSVSHLGGKPVHQFPKECIGAPTARHAQPQSLLVDVQYCKGAARYLRLRTAFNGTQPRKSAVITGDATMQGPGKMGLSSKKTCMCTHLCTLTPEAICRAVTASASRTDMARCARNVCGEDDRVAHMQPLHKCTSLSV